MLAIKGAAHASLHDFAEADKELTKADGMCSSSEAATCGDVSRALGVLAMQRDQVDDAEKYFRRSLQFARAHDDRFLEETALLNLSAASLGRAHFDEAIDWADAAYKVSTALDARGEVQADLGNLGWAYYKLGDFERSLDASREALNGAVRSGNAVDELYWRTNVGYVYASLGDFDRARDSYLQALQLARQIKSRAGIYNALRALALVPVDDAALQEAEKYADEAAAIARESGSRAEELYPLLVLGQIAARRGDSTRAQQIYAEIEHDPACLTSLKWEAQHSTARLYEGQKRAIEAESEYRSALATFESARSDVRREDFQLSFLTNASQIYDDYIHFLIAHGKTQEALRWADYSRARTLSEGLGLLGKDRSRDAGNRIDPPQLDAQAISARRQGTLLYYWLGKKQSYLWAITPKRTELYTLPPGPEIEAQADRYRKAVTGPADVLASGNEDGQRLYRTLIEPAQKFLAKNGRVIVIADGNLNNLNFESLIAPGPAPHYFIDDAVISSASSLRILAASQPQFPKRKLRQMLLVGNSISPSDQYPALPNAQAQMDGVARHFSDGERRIIAGAQATPASYLASHPEQFSHIHFVAHGTAPRLSPLDSAIILSQDPEQGESFKLYARDIILHPLHADLVTISACYGEGVRAYSGEGLVGLAWAFLRAGAHRVIAALWDVSDDSTEQLMDRFYDELDKGSAPDAALRAAKLSLLHGSTFRNPYYWAPFQLYSGK